MPALVAGHRSAIPSYSLIEGADVHEPADRELPEPTGYEIRIKGLLSESCLAAFEDLTVTVNPVETVIRGSVLDQSALYGVLDRIQALGLQLIEVRHLPPPPAADP